jgi:hypothetical protein
MIRAKPSDAMLLLAGGSFLGAALLAMTAVALWRGLR